LVSKGRTKIFGKLLLVIYLLAISLPLFPFSPVSAISISYTPFWFSISEPTTISHPDMSFKVFNLGSEPARITVSCLVPENLNISAHFQWSTIILNASGSVSNAYSLTVNSTLSVTTKVIFRVLQLPVNTSDNQILSSATVVNYITYYSQSTGSILKINIIDQSGTPVDAFVDIKYRINDSFAWTPIKTFNGSSNEGLYPLGYYYIRAIDQKSGRIGEKTFELTNNTEIDVQISMIVFRSFIVLIEGEQDDQNKDILLINRIGFEAYIDNYVQVESGVEIYGELFLNGKSIEETNRDYHQGLDQISMYKLKLWFSERYYPTGEYTVKAYIFVGGVKAVEEYRVIPYYIAPQKPFNITFEQIGLFLSFVIILYLIIKNRRLINDREQKESS